MTPVPLHHRRILLPTAALVSSLTNFLSKPSLAQLSAGDSGRYSSCAEKLVCIRVHLSRRSSRLVSL